jgi:hypothetical protein
VRRGEEAEIEITVYCFKTTSDFAEMMIFEGVVFL